MKYYELLSYSKEYPLEKILELISLRKEECRNHYDLREKHISWMKERPVSLEKLVTLKKEEWEMGYDFYGYGFRYDELISALEMWENFYSPLNEIEDLEILEKSLKYDGSLEIIRNLQNQAEQKLLWVQKLMDAGKVDTDGKTVLANSLDSVAAELRDMKEFKNTIITKYHLKRFVKASDGKPFSESSIKKAVNLANLK